MSSRRVYQLSGYLIVAASLLYVIDKVYLLIGSPDVVNNIGSTIVFVLGASVVYAGISFLLSYSWSELLMQQKASIPLVLVHHVYGKTQIAKYLPGNIFHFVGRHAVFSKYGVPHRTILAAAVTETLGLLLSAVFVFVLLLVFTYHYYRQHLLSEWAVFGVLLAVAGGLWLLHRRRAGEIDRLRRAIRALFGYCLFFLIGGILLLMLVLLIGMPLESGSYLVVISSYPVAWLLGYVVPGAPSGIGVREASLIYLLTPVLGGEASVLIALLFRLVTIFGDVIYFSAAGFGLRPEVESEVNQ